MTGYPSPGPTAGPGLDVARMRDEYQTAGIDVDDLDADPIAQFHQWLSVAVDARVTEANAMVLSTVDPDGQPWSRFVLLKDVDERGFTFYTNYSSNKSKELVQQPRAALTFGWLELRRQVNIAGSVNKVDDAESDAYWAVRPRGSQLGSAASRQSEPVPDRSVIERWYHEAEARWADGSVVPRPPYWGGWRLEPHTIEFWQGRLNRLHDRIRYRRAPAESAGWIRQRLSP